MRRFLRKRSSRTAKPEPAGALASSAEETVATAGDDHADLPPAAAHTEEVCGMPYAYSSKNGYYTGQIDAATRLPHGMGAWRDESTGENGAPGPRTLLEGVWDKGNLQAGKGAPAAAPHSPIPKPSHRGEPSMARIAEHPSTHAIGAYISGRKLEEEGSPKSGKGSPKGKLGRIFGKLTNKGASKGGEAEAEGRSVASNDQNGAKKDVADQSGEVEQIYGNKKAAKTAPPSGNVGPAKPRDPPLTSSLDDSSRTGVSAGTVREEELIDKISTLARPWDASSSINPKVSDLMSKLSDVLSERDDEKKRLERERDELARKLAEANARLGEANGAQEAPKREGKGERSVSRGRRKKPPAQDGGGDQKSPPEFLITSIKLDEDRYDSPVSMDRVDKKHRKKKRSRSRRKAKKKAEKEQNAEKREDIIKQPVVKVEVKPKGMGRRGSSNSIHAQRFDNIYAAPQEMIGNFVAPIHEKSEDDEEFLLDALADNFVFNTLDKSELHTLVEAFENYDVKRGENIVVQGQTGGHFYVLRSGKVAYVVNGKEVGHATPGNSFGELALLYNAPHGATYVAKDDDVRLWRVDQVTFRKMVAAHTIKNDNQTMDILRKVPFMSDLDDEFIHRISNALTKVYYDAGDKIFERGSEGSVLYVIRDGEVKYKRKNRAIKVLGPGDYFGEQAIVKNEPRKADATATRDTIALALSREVFEKVLGPLSDVITRSKDRSILRTVPLFANSDIENFEIELMGALIDEVKYPTDYHILAEGDYVDVPALYLVRSGCLEAYSEDGESRILKKGSFFGEDTLMPDEDQKYGGKGGMKQSHETVEVLEDCVLGKLTLANIDSVILDLGRMGNNKPVGERNLLDRSIDIMKLERHTLLGSGSFGQVWLASDRDSGKAYALKVQIKRELIDQEQTRSACREREVMSKIDNPFIIRLVNTAQDHQSIFMLLDLVQGGELFNVLHNDVRDNISENEAKFYSAGILEGLAYMHRRRIVYRDLKPENVLIDELGYPVLVDLGFAKVINDKTYTLCGTPLYLAPEVILSRGHDKGADYWSLGCLMYEMILGQTPFFSQNVDQITLFNRIVNGRYYFHSNHISDDAQDLISGMLVKKSTQRLGCLAQGERDIKDHPFMSEINFGKLSKRMLKAPWVPMLRDPLDASCFESWDHLKNKETAGNYKPLNAKEQDIFHEF